MKRPVLVFLIGCLVISVAAAQTAPEKKLTIESIFADGGLTGRGPENIQWSLDHSRLSYVQRDDSGDHGELLFFNALTGEKGILVSEQKLSSLAPPVNQIKDEREKERLRRYNVAAYLWAPDSKHLLFNSKGQLWFYSLDSGTAVQFTSAPDPSGDPKFSPDGGRVAYLRKHNLYIRTVSGDSEKQITKDKDENLLDGEVDWVYSKNWACAAIISGRPAARKSPTCKWTKPASPAIPSKTFHPCTPKWRWKNIRSPVIPIPLCALAWSALPAVAPNGFRLPTMMTFTFPASAGCATACCGRRFSTASRTKWISISWTRTPAAREKS